jgi:tetratricopeptide (TPR) repeat protein
VIFSGEICVYCGRPITVDDKNPQLGRCRKCSAPYHTQCWFGAGEKCCVPSCDGKASDIGAPKIKETVGEVCPFLPPVTPRTGGEPQPATCLRTDCMLYDAVERRCGLGEIAYALATARQNGRQTRHLLQQAVGGSSKQTIQLLNTITTAMKGAEKDQKSLVGQQEKAGQVLAEIASILREVKGGLGALATDQQAAAEGFDRLARAVEAGGVGERVRSRRESRLAARSALRDGRPSASISLLLQAQKRGGDESVANDLAAAYVHAGKPEEAQGLLEKVLGQEPGYTPCRLTLAHLKLKAGLAQEAEALLKGAPAPPSPQMRAELAYARACVAYAVGRSEDAVALLNEALDEDPWHADAAAALLDLRARRTGGAVPDAAAIALTARGMRAAADG